MPGRLLHRALRSTYRFKRVLIVATEITTIGGPAGLASAQFYFGGFAPHVEYDAGPTPRAIALADLTGDGKLDIVVTNQIVAEVSVLPAHGNGTFGARVVVAGFDNGIAAQSIALGDFNNDGFLDLAFASGEEAFTLLSKGNDGLSFGEAVPLPTKIGWAQRVAAADLNDDGLVDLAVMADAGHGIEFFLGNGNGAFSLYSELFPIWHPTSIILSDLNGDGFVDVAVTSPAIGEDPSQVFASLNAGDATFAAPQSFVLGTETFPPFIPPVPSLGYPSGVTAGSLNDKFFWPFIAATNESEDTVSLFVGNDQWPPNPTPTILHVGPMPRDIARARLQVGEGINGTVADLVVANAGNGTVSVLLGSGVGAFVAQQTFAVGASPRALAIADLNGSGVDDIVVTNSAGGTVSVLINLTLDAPKCTFADINCDGVVDVFDLLELLAAWGECDDCPKTPCLADLDGNCAVDVMDLLILLGNWG
jgi:hypothetical protein